MNFFLRTILILAVLLPIKCSADLDNLNLKTIYRQVSGIPRLANNLLLESEFQNGNKSPIEVMQQILNRQFDENYLKEYSEMELFDGLKGEKELLDMLNEEKKSEISDEMRKDIENGLKGFEVLAGFKTELDAIDLGEISKNFEVMKNISSTISSSFIDEELRRNFEGFGFDGKYLVEREEKFNNLNANEMSNHRLINEIYGLMHEMMKHIEGTKYVIKALVVDITNSGLPISFPNLDSITPFKKVIVDLTTEKDGIPDVKNFTLKLTAMEKNMKQLEALRDSKEVKDIIELMKKLKNPKLISGFNILDKKMLKEYEGVKSASPLIQKIISFSSFMRTVEWKVPYFSSQWAPFENHFENLKIPNGDLTATPSGLSACLKEPIDFSIDKLELEKIEESSKKLESMNSEITDNLKELKELDFTGINEKMDRLLSDHGHEEDGLVLQKGLHEILKPIEAEKLNRVIKFFGAENGKRGQPNNTIFEIKFLEMEGFLHGLKFDGVKTLINRIPRVKQLLDCHSQLKISIEDTVALMDLPKTAWNFDMHVLFGTVETMSLLKDAYKKIEDIKNWKPENNSNFEGFPLSSEEVKEIFDGVKVIKSILKIYENWNEMKNEWDEEEFEDSMDTWKSINSSVFNLVENLSKIDSKLEDLPQIIASIPFPEEFPVEEFKKFIKDDYQGGQWEDILNILEDFQKLKNDFPEFSTKLEKMNGGIGKLREWEKSKKPEVEEKQDSIDCLLTSLNSCKDPITLPDASPLPPLKKVEL